ncbi:MAG: CDP-alcohol phosphatidyltransferase family protein [Bacilli bacterium]|nr:CDP-alcohol phosphatidyltransferase family protein [Bacilli bacterium]
MTKINDTVNSSIKALFNPENKMSLIPNWLSFSRALGGIAIPIMINKKSPYKIIIGTMSFMAISDFLDGYAARKLVKEETEEGAMLDAISDKIFSLSLLIGACKENRIFILNAFLESLISIINANSLNKGEEVKSNMLGKIKIWPLSIAILTSYASIINNNYKLMNISKTLSIMTVPLEIVNVIQYKKKTR